MIRALSILAAVAALAVSAAPASAGTPETAKGACHVPGFMDYTDDSCMSKPRWGSAPASALASRSGGEVVSDFAKSKPKPAVYDHGITQGRKKAAPPKPPGLGVTYFKGELVGIEPSFRKALPKPRGISGDVYHYGATRVTPKGRGAGYVANHTDGTVSIIWNPGDGTDRSEPKTRRR